MKVVILAGGKGTRLSEETVSRPKPMVEIGGYPILWHIMNIYATHGCSDFVIACGYKGDFIKTYFGSYFVHSRDFVVDLSTGKKEYVGTSSVDWTVGCIDTGLETMTGGRILRLREILKDDTFMVTYGDGLSNVDISALLSFHREHGRIATVTAVHPTSRFGALELEAGTVRNFSEKPQTSQDWINGGFFVFEPTLFDYLENDRTILEREPLQRLARDGELMAFSHRDFWQPMDTLREKTMLEEMWDSGNAPWKVW